MAEGTNTGHKAASIETRPTAERLLWLAVTVGAVLFWAVVMYNTRSPWPRFQFAILFFGMATCLYALDRCRRALVVGRRTSVVALSASVVVLAVSTWYFYRHALDFLGRGELPPVGLALGALTVLVLGYLTWREFGALVLVVLGAILYAFLGPILPGTLGHEGFEPATLLWGLLDNGVYGFFTQQTGLVVAFVVLYTALAFGYGGFGMIRGISDRASSDRGFAAAFALASAAVASINGSYLANAELTGRHTVSELIDRGLSPRTAAGIEAAASTAGQVLPVTALLAGVGVLVMSGEYTPLTFLAASLVPAAILLCCLVVAIALAVGAERTPGVTAEGDETRFSRPEDDVVDTTVTDSRLTIPHAPSRSDPTPGRILIETLRLGLPLLVLLSLYLLAERPLSTASFWAILTLLATGVVTPALEATYRSIRHGAWFDGRAENEDVDQVESSASFLRSIARFPPVSSLLDALEGTLWGLRWGALVLAPVVIVVAALDMAVELLLALEVHTVGHTLATVAPGGPYLVVALGLLVALFVTPGVPTVAAAGIAGLFVSVLAVETGVGEIPTALAALYLGIAAGVAPPFAVAASRTARIAGVRTRAAARVAMRLLAPLFVLPFAFVSHPELVSATPTLATLRAAILSLVGGFAIAYALNGRFETPLRDGPFRFGLLALGGLAMAYPAVVVQVVAGTACLAVGGWLRYRQ